MQTTKGTEKTVVEKDGLCPPAVSESGSRVNGAGVEPASDAENARRIAVTEKTSSMVASSAASAVEADVPAAKTGMPGACSVPDPGAKKEKPALVDRIGLTVMIAVSLLLIPILLVNLTLIIKGAFQPVLPPDVFGIAPLAVSSGSMEGDREDSFAKGSLIFVRLLGEEEKEQLEPGDVITFRSEEVYVTHRIVSVNRDTGGHALSFVTQGDANNTTDGAIPAANVVGICVGSVAGLGNFAMFLQTPAGVALFIGVPVLLFIIFDLTRILVVNRRARQSEAATAASRGRMLADRDREIERLRALLDARGGLPPDGEVPPPPDPGKTDPEQTAAAASDSRP